MKHTPQAREEEDPPPDTDILSGIGEGSVVCFGQLHAGEEIRDDSFEEGNVVREELWQIDIHDGAKHLQSGMQSIRR